MYLFIYLQNLLPEPVIEDKQQVKKDEAKKTVANSVSNSINALKNLF